MHIYGILMLRDEADILAVNVLYHLSLGLDKVLIVDNGSSDGTDRILRRLARDKRVRWTRDDSPYRQSEIVTELAREAFRSDADWVAPLDADEFFYAPRNNLREILADSKAGGAQSPDHQLRHAARATHKLTSSHDLHDDARRRAGGSGTQ
jgi:glycosyltransferase involved in cell wall biosynthesis